MCVRAWGLTTSVRPFCRADMPAGKSDTAATAVVAEVFGIVATYVQAPEVVRGPPRNVPLLGCLEAADCPQGCCFRLAFLTAHSRSFV